MVRQAKVRKKFKTAGFHLEFPHRCQIHSSCCVPIFSLLQPITIRTSGGKMATNTLDLPAELRDMVYDYLWLSSPLIDLRPGAGLEIYADYLCKSAHHHEDDNDPDTTRHPLPLLSGLPLWLLTSKTILQEGLKVFCRNGQVHLSTAEKFASEEDDDDDDDDNTPPPPKSWYNRQLFSPLLSPYSCRNLSIEPAWAVNVAPDVAGRLPFIMWEPRDLPYYHDLFADVEKAGAVKQLQFRFETTIWPRPHGHKVDLEPLGKMVSGVAPMLNRFAVFFGLPEGHGAKTRHINSIERKLWREVRKLDLEVLVGMKLTAQRAMGSRLYQAGVMCGWVLVWTRGGDRVSS
ncbi:hypothetical protein BDU57DRAFT_531238 [Ampelomyces quisqualis]|uniref:Uncharacterized protein n=1 Tax=Ampelomyces quisqualis TaxID=50730 RepID=A0A6A5QHK1_AMPQU|nr:hypothetical protein BDU57DRAFT_531238 [Ampelomyces quisqualis]